MKKSRLSLLFMVTLLTTVFVLPQLALGEGFTKSISVLTGNIKIMVDGEFLQTDKQPFIYNGTTYVPLRAVAQAVGKKVEWDPKNSIAIIGDNKTGGKYLETLGYYNYQTGAGGFFSLAPCKGFKDKNGAVFNHGYVFSTVDYGTKEENWHFADFKLSGNYKKFKTYITFVKKGTGEAGTGAVKISVDGKEQFFYRVGEATNPIPIEINVENKNNLRLGVFEYDGGEGMDIAFTNAVLQ